MPTDKLTDDERRAPALTPNPVAQKIKDEYGDALASLGMLPVVERVWPYTVEEHVENARRRGITLDADAQRIQREYLDLLRGASLQELNLVADVLTRLLDFDRLKSTDHVRFINEIIAILSHVEVAFELSKQRGYDEREDAAGLDVPRRLR